MTSETIIKILFKLFKLIDGRIPQNICKVFCVAFIAGTLLSIACLEGPYLWRAVFSGIFCLLLACFFGSMAALYEEVIGGEN